jgi:hypothetical protein
MLNDLLWNYCKKAKIKMSRSRPYKKNDNAWVEQRNWTHVRKVVGYRRPDTPEELAIMRALYGCLGLYKNFFQPTMKLKEKVREGGKIHRKYGEVMTPYQRLMESDQISGAARQRLQAQYERLSVAKLQQRIEQLRTRLFDAIEAKQHVEPSTPRRHGPAIRVSAVGQRIWMREMLANAE